MTVFLFLSVGKKIQSSDSQVGMQTSRQSLKKIPLNFNCLKPSETKKFSCGSNYEKTPTKL
jgi:hypothetical protein